jgi:CheY-like chemotaxis protein
METTRHRILAVVDNLFFAAKINAAAAIVGAEVGYARGPAETLRRARAERPGLIIVDLDAAGCAPLETLAGLTADPEVGEIPTLGFVSHVATELQERARETGCDRVVARSVFARDLPLWLARPTG